MVPQVGWVRRTFDELLEKVEHLGRLDRVFPGMRVRMARGWDHVERECMCLHGVRRELRNAQAIRFDGLRAMQGGDAGSLIGDWL